MVGSLRGGGRAYSVGASLGFSLKPARGGRAPARHSLEISQPRAVLGDDGGAFVWMATANAVRVPSAFVTTAATHHIRPGGSFVGSIADPGATLIAGPPADRSTTMNAPSVAAGHSSTMAASAPTGKL